MLTVVQDQQSTSYHVTKYMYLILGFIPIGINVS